MSQLLDQVRARVRSRHYSIRTEEAYLRWIREYIIRPLAKVGFVGVANR
jgi:hypothetical protein